jgi:hypothetical protein
MDARQAYHRARDGRNVIGWLLPAAERARLLERFAPAYERVIAHHVTLRPRVHRGSKLPPERAGEVIGVADDGHGVQALVVRIGGTHERPGGGTYHVTWSLAEGRRPKESNDVLQAGGWTLLEEPIRIALEPGVVG